MVLFQDDIDTKEICKRVGNLERLLAVFVFVNLQKNRTVDNVTWQSINCFGWLVAINTVCETIKYFKSTLLFDEAGNLKNKEITILKIVKKVQSEVS